MSMSWLKKINLTVEATNPKSIPQKYPLPLNRHQTHFKTLAAVYPPNREAVIHNVIEFREEAKKPKVIPITMMRIETK